MADTVKTAVSLDRKLLEQAQALAETLRLSRSRVMALALEEFIRRNENRRMLEQLNAVYGEPEDEAERASREGMKELQGALADREW